MPNGKFATDSSGGKLRKSCERVGFETDGVYRRQGREPSYTFRNNWLSRTTCPEQGRWETKAAMEEGRLSLGKPG